MKKNDLLFDSTGYVLNLLEKILDANIKIKGKHNIPKNNPRIFIANHFTRIEAILVPYILNNISNKKVGVIADDSLFNTAFGSLLKNIGALKKSNPYRNNIILGDLLTSCKDWMIFPEGLMVKEKDITKQGSHYCVKVDKTCQRVYTGSAFFALYSQLLRKNYLDKNIKNLKKFKRKYFLDDCMDINTNETMIVPINISYSKIRKGENFLMTMADKLFEEMGENFKEELEIESNIILNSTMNIHILKPISIKDILNDAYSKEKNYNKIINKYREDLTHTFMTQVYENLTISFDHIFILTLFLYPRKKIQKEHFKRLLYLIFNDIKNSNLFYTKEIKQNMINLISYEKYEDFEEVLNIAKNDNILLEDDDFYILNKKELLNEHTHNTIRLKNILKVVLNEIILIEDVKRIIYSYNKENKSSINSKLFSLLKKEEKDEYDKDYKKYKNHKDIKDKKIGKSFFLRNRSDTCIISLHGFSSSPKEVQNLASILHKKDLDIYAPRLKGHGTVAIDLKNTTYKDWYDSLSRAIIMCTLKYKKIYLLGFSTGGLLTLLSERKSYKELEGLICINAALNLNDIRVKTLIPAVSFWNDLLSSFHANEYAKEYVHNEAENPSINYDKHYIDSIKQLSLLMNKTKKSLKKVKTPILIIQSKNDPVVNPSSAYEIFEKIQTKDKKLKIIDSKKHVIITQNNKTLIKAILNFIFKNKLK